MRTVTYRLVDLIHAVLKIGREGENEYTRVQFDCKKVFDDYPSAIPALTVVNPSGTAYPAVITRDGDYVIWDVTDSDLTMHGDGKAQLTFTENGVVVKSCIANTRIDISIAPNGTIPDPVQNWIDNATEVLGEVEDAIPAGGTTGQVLAKKTNADRDLEWVDQTGGGGGTSNYNELTNKPSIGGVTLSGNKTLHDLGAATEDAVNAKYTKPGTGIPASDLASGVIPDVTGKADKVSSATSGNFAALDSNGNLTDSGKKASDFATPSDVNAKYTKPQTGIPASDMASGVQTSLGKADSAYQLPSGGVPSSDMASAVQTSLGKADTAYQVPSGGIPASDMASGVQTSIGKADTAYQKPQNGIPASDLASGVIPSVPVTDVQVNGTTILNNGVANVPVATDSTPGVMKLNSQFGLWHRSSPNEDTLMISKAAADTIQAGSSNYQPIVPGYQHYAAFYGLAKAAGVDLAGETVTLGQYPNSAKIAIANMLGLPQLYSPLERIADYTVAQDSDEVNVTTDIYGNPFKLAHAQITLMFGTEASTTNDYISGSILNPDGIKKGLATMRLINGSKCWMIHNFMSFGGLAICLSKSTATGNTQTPQMATYNETSQQDGMKVISMPYITGVQFKKYSTTTTPIIAGSRVIIYGCRVIE